MIHLFKKNLWLILLFLSCFSLMALGSSACSGKVEKPKTEPAPTSDSGVQNDSLQKEEAFVRDYRQVERKQQTKELKPEQQADSAIVDSGKEQAFPDLKSKERKSQEPFLEKAEARKEKVLPDFKTRPEPSVDQGSSRPDRSNRCKNVLVAPSTQLWPVPGELFYMQLGLSGFSLGESAVVVSPKGQIALIDVGNDSHAKVVRAAVNTLIDKMNQTSGYSKRSKDTVDYIFLTHFHADHVDGLKNLLKKVKVTAKVFHRGLFDLAVVKSQTAEKVCKTLANHLGKEFLLCKGPKSAPCGASWQGTYPASGCPALQAGNLLLPNDSGPAFVPFPNKGSRIDLIAVNGIINGKSYEKLVGKMDKKDSNGENARSLVGLLRHGHFVLQFNGDLTGGGSKTDNVEAFYLKHFSHWITKKGIDLLHAGHHGRNTSSSLPWVERLLPSDGKSRNVVMGISTAHVRSPHKEVLQAIFSKQRLGRGFAWATRIAPLGTKHKKLISADGGVILIRTGRKGQIYHLQALNKKKQVIQTKSYYSVSGCP